MAKAIKLSQKLVDDATINGLAQHRSPPKQIEYWASIGKIVEENPDLPFSLIRGILVGLEEVKAGDVSGYEFG